MKSKRALGLDVGDVRIGIAVSDELGMFASGIGVVKREQLEKDITKILDFAKEYEASVIVAGLPISMSGKPSAQTHKVSQFLDELKKRTVLPVLTVDERLSTVQGERLLIDADVSRKKRKNVIDKLAAQIILQLYLDTNINRD